MNGATPSPGGEPLSGEKPRQALPAELLHDLCTPLNHIIGYSEMLTEQAQDEGQTGFVPDLQEILDSAQQMLVLLNQSAARPADAAPDADKWTTNRRRTDRRKAIDPDAVPPQAGTRVSEQTAPAATVSAWKAAGVESPPAGIEAMPNGIEAMPNGIEAMPVGVQAMPAGTAGALILVVDDDRRNREMLSRRLEREGYRTVMAVNGNEAMQMARSQPFDLVLLDIMMPEMDGYEVLRRLKADAVLHPIPVIMISALDEMDSVVRCIELGAEDYLPKPFNPILLKARIGACLEKKRVHALALRFTTELQENYDRLQKLEKLRDDLTHMIVHDLRTPLTSVILGMQTLEAIGGLDTTQAEIVEISVNGGDTLLGIINDLLDVEQMESGSMQLDLAPLDSDELVASAARQVATLLKSGKLKLLSHVTPALPELRADTNKLRRVLVNLLGNAIKFTPGGGTVSVDVRPGADGRCVEFSVSDTGEGIPAAAFGRIFEKFGQVESRQGGRVMSTGLGLTFCKLAVEAHGGQITVESLPGQGSTFRFTIPSSTAPGSTESDSAAAQ